MHLTIPQAALVLNCTEDRIRLIVKTGELIPVDSSRKVRFEPSVVAEYAHGRIDRMVRDLDATT